VKLIIQIPCLNEEQVLPITLAANIVERRKVLLTSGELGGLIKTLPALAEEKFPQ